MVCAYNSAARGERQREFKERALNYVSRKLFRLCIFSELFAELRRFFPSLLPLPRLYLGELYAFRNVDRPSFSICLINSYIYKYSIYTG